MADDFIDNLFADLHETPGTTPGRSRKALRRAQGGGTARDEVVEEVDEGALDTWELWGRQQWIPVIGREVEVFPIRSLAFAWDQRADKTVRRAEESGMLPKPNIYAPRPSPPGKPQGKGERLYLHHQIVAVVRVTTELGIFSRQSGRTITTETRTAMRRRLLDGWSPEWIKSAVQRRST